MFAKNKLRIGETNIAAIELGGSKISAHVYQVCAQTGGLKHKASTIVQSRGLSNSTIENLDYLEESILNAIHNIELQVKTTIKQLYISIPSGVINSSIATVSTELNDKPVSNETIKQLHHCALSQKKNSTHRVLHILPIHYTLDDLDQISDPRKMIGQKLSTKLHLVSASKSFLDNINQIFKRADIKIKSFVAAPYACGLSILKDDEKYLGATIVDFGATSTTISCFSNGTLVFFKNIPTGSHHITHDIARHCSLSLEASEKAKIQYGFVSLQASSMGESTKSTNLGQGTLDTNIRQQIGPIIMATLEKLTFQLHENLSEVDQTLCDKIILTGGGSLLNGLSEFWSHGFQKTFHKQQKFVVATPNHDPSLAASLGAIQYGYFDYYNKFENFLQSNRPMGTLHKIKKWFNEDL